MPAKRKPHVPPVRANADGTGFQRVDAEPNPRAHLSRLVPPSSSSSRPAPVNVNSRGDRAARPTTQDNRVSRAPHRRGIPNADDSDGSTGNSEFTSTSGSSSSSPVPRKDGRGARQPVPAAAALVPAVQKGAAQASKPSATPSGTISGTATVSLHITVDNTLLSSEVKLSPACCRQLGVLPGALVRLSTTSPNVTVAVAEVLMSKGLPSDCAALNNDTASLFAERQLVAQPAALSSAPKLGGVSALTVAVHPPMLDGRNLRPAAGSALQWSALFRQHFRHHVVYGGLRATLRLATHPVEVEVTDLVAVAPPVKGESLAFGLLSDATDIYVTFVGTDATTASSDAPVAEPPSGELSKYGDVSTHDVVCAAFAATATESRHLLVVGGAGTGKSYQLAQIAAHARREGRRELAVRAEELPQGDDSEVHTASAVAEMFRQAAAYHAPCVVTIDDLDLLCGSTASSSVGSQWAMSLVATALCEQLRHIRRQRLDIIVAVSSASRTSLHPSLLSPDYFGGAVVELKPPASADARMGCFQSCLRGLLGDATYDAMSADERNSAIEAVADAHGYTQRDLHRVGQAAALLSFEARGSTSLRAVDVVGALKTVRPSALRQFEVSVPDVTWDDIGGSEEAKRTLCEVVEWCLGKQSWIFGQFNITPPKGVLLYGPPGCSKTMLAKALAHESRMNFVSVKGPEVFSKWVGDSEKAIRDIFTRARAASPCVVFIDELDGMCGHRGRGGVSDRVVSQFLTELDGLPAAFASQDTALVFVAATNRPDSIDEAVLRPGRIDRLVYVGLPDRDEREAIVRIQFRALPTAEDLTCAYVAEKTEGYTGAEVVAVVKESAFTAVSVNLQAPFITCNDVDAALIKVRPRIAPADVEWYHQWAHGKK